MVGDEAVPYRVMLELSHPVAEGVVNNWPDMELVWDHGFKKLGVNCSESSILMTEAVMNPFNNRKRMTEVVFEKFGFARL